MRSDTRFYKPGRTAQLYVVLRLNEAGRVLARFQPVAVDGNVVRHWDAALLRVMHGSPCRLIRAQPAGLHATGNGVLPHHRMLL
jgi:hypothetical protein